MVLYNYSTSMLEYISSNGWWYSLSSDEWTLLEKKKKLHTKVNGCHLTTDILPCFSGQYSLPFCDYPNLSFLSSCLWNPLPFSPDDFAYKIRREFGFPAPQTHLYLYLLIQQKKDVPCLSEAKFFSHAKYPFPFVFFRTSYSRLSPNSHSSPIEFKHWQSSLQKYQKTKTKKPRNRNNQTKTILIQPHLLFQVQLSVFLTANIRLLYFSHH